MDLLKIVFPIITKKFWFVNSYLALYLISPFLNKLIHSLTKKQFEYMILLLVIMFPLRLTLLPLTWSQDGSGGMSVILFFVLYCIAAWLRLYYQPESPQPRKYLLCYLGTVLFLVLSKWLLLKVISEPYTTKLYGYISIFTIFAAVSLFLFFLYRKQITGRMKKLVLKVASHSFSVYIIHFCMIKALFCNILHLDDVVSSALIGMPAVILSCILVFSVCVLIDMGRTALGRKIEQSIRQKGGLRRFDAFLERWNQIADIT